MRKPTIRPMRRNRGLRIIYLPDVQSKPDVPLCHLEWAGKHIANRKPDVVVQGGDFADMGSCSTHDEPGSLAAEGRSISADLAVARKALKILGDAMRPWRGRKVLTLGNHENRLARYVEAHPEHRHTYARDPFGYEAAGWEVHPFLKPVIIAGVAFAHYFPRSASGAIMQTKNGAPNALTMVKREMRSCVAGHRQGLDTACYSLGDRMLRGVIAGSFYLHDEDYLSEQGRHYWAGILELNEAHNGYFDLVEVSIDYLCRRWGGGKWPK